MRNIVYAAGITSAAHERALLGCLRPLATSEPCLAVAEEDPDLERLLGEWADRNAGAIVIDRDGLPHREVSDADLVRAVSKDPSLADAVVYVFGPQDAKSDPFVQELKKSGVSRFVLPRYEASRDSLLSAISRLAADDGWGDGQAGEYLDGLPDPTKSGRFPSMFGRRKGQEAPDLLADDPVEADAGAGAGKMSELEYFRETLALAVPDEAVAAADRQLMPAMEENDEEEKMIVSNKDRDEIPAAPEPKPEAAQEPQQEAEAPEAAEQAAAPGAADGGNGAQGSESGGTEPEGPLADECRELSERFAAGEITAEELLAALSEAKERAEAPKRMVVAVANAVPVSGATHMAISTAVQLAGLTNAPTACVMHDATELEELCGALGSSEHRGVRICSLADGLPEDCEVVVVDCGPAAMRGEGPAAEAWESADVRLACASASEWKNLRDLAGLVGSMAADQIEAAEWCLFAMDPDVQDAFGKFTRDAGAEVRPYKVPFRPRILDAKISAAHLPPSVAALVPDGGSQR